MRAGTLPTQVPETTIPTQEEPDFTYHQPKNYAQFVPVANGSMNMPISWPQLLGGWLSDLPFFLMAALGVLATWLQSSAPVTTRGAVTVAILAILAGLTAVQRATGTDGLSLRLRSMGQIRSGK
jgi:hypothetical protein